MCIRDSTTEEIEYLLKLSKNFKDMKRAGVPHRYLEGKNIVLLFQKTSTDVYKRQRLHRCRDGLS